MTSTSSTSTWAVPSGSRSASFSVVSSQAFVAAARAEEVIQTIVKASRTGKIGDGKIFVYDIGEAIRIRNNERGDAAL